MQYVVLLRGINVGGRNKVPMPALREQLGARSGGRYGNVRSYIQSGNLLLRSDLGADEVAAHVERTLPNAFALDTSLVRVLVLGEDAYRHAVAQAPPGFGSEPETYRYDVGFYLGTARDEVEPHLRAHPEVDEVSCGDLAFYHRRLTARASSSWLTRIVGSPVYGSLTLRNWRTTTALQAMLDEA